MKDETVKKPLTMWHPSFVASLKLELWQYYEYLKFESELPLNQLPRQIDAVVIILREDIKIDKNFARIFRRHNVFEYKSPNDTLSTDDYYNGLSYALQYKAIGGKDITIDSLTLSFVCFKKPVKLLRHLRERGQLGASKDGIYEINGNQIPVQIIASKYLPEDENTFLYGLREKLKAETIERIYGLELLTGLHEEIFGTYLSAVTNANAYEILGVMEMLNAAANGYDEKVLKRARNVIKIYGFDKEWDEAVEKERQAKVKAVEKERQAKIKAVEKERQAVEKERQAVEKERQAVEKERQAKEKERQAKEKVIILEKRIKELEMQLN